MTAVLVGSTVTAVGAVSVTVEPSSAAVSARGAPSLLLQQARALSATSSPAPWARSRTLGRRSVITAAMIVTAATAPVTATALSATVPAVVAAIAVTIPVAVDRVVVVGPDCIRARPRC